MAFNRAYGSRMTLPDGEKEKEEGRKKTRVNGSVGYISAY
jgi:hypothetical protein